MPASRLVQLGWERDKRKCEPTAGSKIINGIFVLNL
jgi:hypothetical protein